MTDVATTAPDLQQRRLAAIEISGWGERFLLWQPRNACLWVYLLVVVLGAHTLYVNVAPTLGVFGPATVASVLTAIVYGAVFLFFLHRCDHWERTPAALAVTALVGGGIGAVWAMALPGNAAVMGLYAKWFGQAWAEDWQAGLTAPFVEETSKGAIFLLMMGLAPIIVRTVYDGLIVGAYVGLGFQLVEDSLYGQNSAAANFGVDQVSDVLSTFAMRAATGIGSHALYTALFSAGLVYVIGTVAQPRRVARGIALMLTAMLAHGLWDSMAALARDNAFAVVGMMLGLTAASLTMLMIAIRWGASSERGWMRDILAPEVAAGVLTELELAATSGDRPRRRADRRAARRADGVSRRRERHIIAAARDLADDLAVSGGVSTPDVERSRAEVRRLRAR